MEDFVGMIKLGKRRLFLCLVLCAVLTLVFAVCSNAALFGLIKSKDRGASAVAKHTLVVFPFDRDSELVKSIPEDFGMNVAEYLRTTLAPSKGYSVLLFEDRLMSVQRAKADNLVKETDTKAPFFTDKAKSAKLADILATDYYLIGSVESYAYDTKTKTVELAIKADLIDCKTGKLVQEFVVGGSAASTGAQAIEEPELRSIAAGKAVDALRDKILSTSTADSKNPAK